MTTPASLWDPIALGPCALGHRLILAAMGTGYAAPGGAVTDRLLRYLERRAEGGAALVVTEAAAVDAGGAPFPGVLRADDDGLLPGLRRLARAIHARGARAAIQIYHAGRQMSRRVSGREPVAPSPLPCPLVRQVPRALEGDEIAALVERFAEAAARAAEAGFDAVELHGGHGYLLHQFLTPLANQRADAWGGDLAGRARFPLAVVRRVRERVGRRLAILYKLSAEDRLPGGLVLEDMLRVGRWLEEAGADALIASAGTYASFEWIVQPLAQPPGCLRGYARALKGAVGIPVAAVGRIHDPALAEDIVRSGDADLVAMGRALLADPDLPRKARAGERAAILPCIACNECLACLMRAQPIRCAVNPWLGREGDLPLARAPRPRRVVVVGAGPAGIQAAITARERGHEVTLLEAAAEVGGRLRLAERPAWKQELAALPRHLGWRLARSGVAARCGTPATPDAVEALAPDAIVVATGARRTRPPIPGLESLQVLTAEECLADPPAAAGAAVVLGGGNAACEAAAWLHEHGWEVTILNPGRDLCRDVETQTRRGVLGALARLGVGVLAEAQAEEVSEGRLGYVTAAGERGVLPVSLVVLAGALRPEEALRRHLEARGREVHAVGDCAGPGDLAAAVHGATELALRL